MAATDVCINCGATRWHALGHRERFVEWAGTGPGTPRVRCEGCGAGQGSSGWYRPVAHGAGPMARLQELPRLWRLLGHARTWHPVPIFYALVVAATAVPGTVLALLTRRRWLAVATPLAAFLGTFLFSARTILQPDNRAFVREVLDPDGSHRQRVAQQVDALRRDGDLFPIVVPASWDGPLRLHGVRIDRQAPDPALRSVGMLAGPAGGDVHHPRLRIEVLVRGDASTDEELVERLAHSEGPAATGGDGRGAGTPVGRGDDDLLVLRMPDPPPERLAELQQSWREATLLVDDVPVPSRLLVGRRVQVAASELGDHVLEITGHDVDLDGLRLRRVTDLGPLIAEFDRDRGGRD